MTYGTTSRKGKTMPKARFEVIEVENPTGSPVISGNLVYPGQDGEEKCLSLPSSNLQVRQGDILSVTLQGDRVVEFELAHRHPDVQ